MGFNPSLDRYLDIEPVVACNFAVMFPDMPQLGYMAASVEMPSFTIERMRLEMFGLTREFPGRKPSTHTLPCSFLYDRKSIAYQSLLSLVNAASDSVTGTWQGKPFTILVEQYDGTGAMVQSRLFRNCWAQELSSYQLDAATDQAVMIPAVFYYERQLITFGAGADAAQLAMLREYQSYGSNPHDLLREAEDIIARGVDTIAGVIRTGAEAIAYGRASLNARAQLANIASNVTQSARSNPLAAATQAINTVRQTVSTARQVSSAVRNIFG